jgi:hypothetical protein
MNPTAAPCWASAQSGHATFAYVTAILFADMVPEKALAIFDRAAIIAHSRVVAGVHYPTDVEAGRIIDNVFLHEPRFMVDFRGAVRRCATHSACRNLRVTCSDRASLVAGDFFWESAGPAVVDRASL